MKHIFIVNPVAGGRDSSESIRAQALSAFSQSGDSFELYRTVGPHDAEEAVRRIAEKRIAHARGAVVPFRAPCIE